MYEAGHCCSGGAVELLLVKSNGHGLFSLTFKIRVFKRAITSREKMLDDREYPWKMVSKFYITFGFTLLMDVAADICIAGMEVVRGWII